MRFTAWPWLPACWLVCAYSVACWGVTQEDWTPVVSLGMLAVLGLAWAERE